MNKVEPKTLPGFMELYPFEQLEFNRIKNIIESTYKEYGFFGLDTPIIELSSVLLAKAGGETEKQIYRFNKGENDLSLRFDLTVPLAKYVASRYNELVFPFKRYQIGKVFRGERNQKGRYREFYQCDIDVIGDEELSLKYDSEMPAIINEIFTKLNIGSFVIRINNRKVLNGLFQSLGLNGLEMDALRILDKIEKVGSEEVRKELNELNISNDSVDKLFNFIKMSSINEARKLSNNELFQEGLNELETVINDLADRNIPSENYKIDFTIARGLDYYTGTVYETNMVDYPNIGSVCSGGRYDSLAEYYTDKKLPGVGISIGLTRLFFQLCEIGIIKSNVTSPSSVLIIPMCEDYKYIYKVNSILKENKVSSNICFIEKGMKQKMKYASRLQYKYVIIIGEDEVNNNSVTLKDMISGEQKIINISKLNNIKNMIEI